MGKKTSRIYAPVFGEHSIIRHEELISELEQAIKDNSIIDIDFLFKEELEAYFRHIFPAAYLENEKETEIRSKSKPPLRKARKNLALNLIKVGRMYKLKYKFFIKTMV